MVDWASVLSSPANGGSAITAYALYWDSGSGGATFTNLVGSDGTYSLTTYTVTSGIVQGSSYEFKVQAQNQWGWGPISSSVTIVASTVPAQMSTPVTSIDPTTGGVLITWSAPDNNGEPLLTYKIEILNEAQTTWS